ncbi:hypothetical protein HYR99_06195 [Candidatus Poribacteria bacterium]|nr:hypothetical protein [Candidatus Poribacteria bacterium]
MMISQNMKQSDGQDLIRIRTDLLQRFCSRNTIAHGNYLLIDLVEYRELHQEIIILMDTFRNQIDNAAITKAYCR